MSSITPNMLLTIPTVGNPAVPDGGPGYATEINAALTLIDAHDHSSGKGIPVTQNGINLTGNLTFANNAATNLGYAGFISQTAALSTIRSLYNVLGELYWTDGSGNQVKITAAGAVNTGGSGNLSGMDGSAAVTYSAVTKTFTLTQSSTFPAKLATGDLSLFETVAAAAQTITIKAPAGLANTFTLTLPGALPATNALPQFSAAGVLSFLAAPASTGLLQSTSGGVLSYVVTGGTLPASLALTTPVFTGTITGTYTLGGTCTLSGALTLAGSAWPSFSAYGTTNQSINNGTDILVIFGTEEFDTNGNFATNAFTPTVAGTYLLSARASLTLVGTDTYQTIELRLYKNGSLYKSGVITIAYPVSGGNNIGSSITAVVQANGTTDVFTIYVTQANSASAARLLTGGAGSQYTWFQGSRIA